MTGSAAAALTGLMFVVITLVARTERITTSPEGVTVFSTPTVVHFATALLASAVFTAPWRSLVEPAVLLGLGGLYGLGRVGRAIVGAWRLTTYQADVEDWIWYTLLPVAAYCAMVVGAVLLFFHPVEAMFAFAGAVALLLFIGIRNAWDVVTYLALDSGAEPPG